MRFVIVTNIPAPYRVPIYNLIAERFGDNFLVIFAAEREPNRLWNLPEIKFSHIFLKTNFIGKKDGFNSINNYIELLSHLRKFNPDIVITTGFNPTHLLTWIYSLLFKRKHISMIDGWLYSEKDLSIIHKFARKIVFAGSQAYIGASKNSFLLFESYGVSKERIFQSHLCIDNHRFEEYRSFHERNYHLLYSGQFIDEKNPLFFARVCVEIKKVIPDLKVAIIGDGILREKLSSTLNEGGVDFDYPGFMSQEELPRIYNNAKLFLFPTLRDAWGIVVNEALASGTPVITSPFTGVINDLIKDTQNGFIVALDVEKWVDICVEIITGEQLWEKLSRNARSSVRDFTFKNAAEGIIKATEYAYSKQ